MGKPDQQYRHSVLRLQCFCDSVKEKIWNEYGLLLTAQILLCVVVLFATVSLLIYLANHWAQQRGTG
jgi:hypothetical protein